MIGIEVHFSNWIAVDQCIDANFIVSRLKVLKRCDEPSRLKWRVLKWPCDWGGWLEPKYVETALPGAG